MAKLHIKKGDTVYVNAGASKGQTGRVLEVIVDKQRAIVEGVNMVSKSTKPNAKNPQGGIVKQEAPIHYQERIVPILMKEFNYTTVMQCPKLQKIVLNQGLGEAVADKKIIEVALQEMTAIAGQKAVATVSKKDIANFKVRKQMPIGVRVTLRGQQMYEFLERLVRVALPRIRDFKGIENKMDGRGNYTLGITEQIIFPEINIDNITKLLGMNITFVTVYRLKSNSDYGKRINESPRGKTR